MAILSQRVLAHDLAHLIDSARLHEKQHVPMHSAVVVRLGHTEAIDFQAVARQCRTDARPDLAQVLLRVPRVFTRPLFVFVTGLPMTGMEF